MIICREATHPSRRTSGSERLRAIISDAMRLNWLILNISFIFSWFSLGITTGFPPSPGPSRGLVRASGIDTQTRLIREDAWGCDSICHVSLITCISVSIYTHRLSQAVLSPSCHHTCCTRWSRAGWTYPASPTPERWLKPPYNRRTSAS